MTTQIGKSSNAQTRTEAPPSPQHKPYECKLITSSATIFVIEDEDITFDGQPLSALYEQTRSYHYQYQYWGAGAEQERGRSRERESDREGEGKRGRTMARKVY